MAGVDEGRLSASYGININTTMSGNALAQADALNQKIQALSQYAKQAGDVAGASLVNNLQIAANKAQSLQQQYSELSKSLVSKIDSGASAKEIQTLQSQLGGLRAQIQDANVELAKAKTEVLNYGYSWRDTGDDIGHALNVMRSELQRTLQDQQSDLAGATTRIAELRQKMKDGTATSSDVKEENNLQSELVAMRSQIAETKTQLNSLNQTIRDYGNACEEAEKQSNNAFDSTPSIISELTDKFKGLAKFTGVAFTLKAAKDFVAKCINVRGEMQSLSAAFTTMLGSKEKADKLLEEATKFAATTPFDLKDVATGAKQLLAYGTASEDIISEMEMLGNVASGLQIPLGDLVYSYGTLRASGRVTTMDIRQFAGRGIPIFEELSKVLGVTNSEVNELVSAGKVSFEQIQQAFRNMTSEGGKFAGLLNSQSELIEGKISNLGDGVYQLMNKIGESIQGPVNTALNAAAASVDWLTENFRILGNIIADAVVAYGSYKAALMVTTALQSKAVKSLFAHTATETLHILKTKAATIAQLAYNKALLANPLALAAAGAMAMVTSIVRYNKALNDGTLAAQKHAKTMEDLNAKYVDNSTEAEKLIARIKDKNTSYEGLEKSMKDLKALYPEIFEQYDIEKVKLTDIKDIQDQIRAANIQRLEDEYNAIQEQVANLEKTKKNLERMKSSAGTTINGGIAGNGVMNISVDNKLTETEQQLQLLKDELADSRFDTLFVGPTIDATKVGSKDTTIKNKKYWEDIKKDAEASLEGLGIDQLNTKTADDLRKKIAEAEANIAKFSTTTKKEVDEQNKLTDEVTKKRQSLFSDLAKGDIEQIKDATEKKVAALEQQRKEELAKLEQERKDLDAAIKKAGGAGLTDEDKAAFAKRSEQINTKYDDETIQIYDDAQEESNKAIEERIKAEQEANAKILSDKWAFLEQYGSIEEQRKAIIERYNKEIADADNGWAKNSLQQEMEQALKSLDFKQLKSSMNWDTVFGDISNVGNGDLVANRSKVSSFLSENRDSLGIDEIKDLEDALKSLDEELASRNPLLAIVTGAKEIGDAKEEYAASAEAFKQSLVEMQTAQQTYDDEVGIAQAARNAGILTETEYQAKLASAQNNLTKAQSKVTASSQRFQKAQNNVRQSTATLISGINEMASSVKEGVEGVADFAGAFDSDLGDGISDAISVLSTFGGIAMDVVSELGKFGTDTVDTMKETAEQTAEGIKQTSETTAASIKAIEAASVILLVIQAVIKTLTAITSIVKANKEADEEAAQAAYNYARALNTLARAQQLAQYDTNFGKDSFSSYTTSISQAGEALSKMNAEIEANKGATANISTGWEKVKKALTTLSGPSGTLKAMIEGQKAYANGISADFVADGRSKWQKFWGKNKNIATFNISEHLDENGVLKGDEFQAWYDEYKDKLSDEQKKTAEAILDNWDDYKESMEAISDYMDDLFSDMGENISDTLVDAFKNGEDAAESLKEVAEKVIEQIIKDFAYAATIQPLINDAQKQINKLNEANGEFSNISQEERMQKLIEITDGLIDNIAGAQEEYNTILQNAKDYAKSKGYETLDNDDERSGEEKGIAQASQDSVDELNGRATAIQGHTYEINESVKGIMEQNRMLITSSGEILTQLMGIHRDTNSLDTRVGIIADGLEDIRTDLSWIRNKGVVAL